MLWQCDQVVLGQDNWPAPPIILSETRQARCQFGVVVIHSLLRRLTWPVKILSNRAAPSYNVPVDFILETIFFATELAVSLYSRSFERVIMLHLARSSVMSK